MVAAMAKKRTTPLARKLRREPTKPEIRFWSHVRGSQLGGFKFVRSFPIGRRVGDFACRSVKVVVEIDGGQHAEQAEEDAERTREIEAFGYTVIRFWNNEVLANTDGVLEALLQHLLMARDRPA